MKKILILVLSLVFVSAICHANCSNEMSVDPRNSSRSQSGRNIKIQQDIVGSSDEFSTSKSADSDELLTNSLSDLDADSPNFGSGDDTSSPF